MKPQSFKNASYHAISKKEFGSILKKSHVEVVNSRLLNEGENLYLIDNGKVLYDLLNTKFFLFECLADFEAYVELFSKMPENKNGVEVIVGDFDIITHKERLVKSLGELLRIEINTKELEILSKLDSIIYNLNDNQLVIDNIHALIAITGEVIIANCQNAEWKYLTHNNSRKPILIVNGTLVDLSQFVNQELILKKEKWCRISFLSISKSILSYC
jgi:hypothetical protein